MYFVVFTYLLATPEFPLFALLALVLQVHPVSSFRFENRLYYCLVDMISTF